MSKVSAFVGTRSVSLLDVCYFHPPSEHRGAPLLNQRLAAHAEFDSWLVLDVSAEVKMVQPHSTLVGITQILWTANGFPTR